MNNKKLLAITMATLLILTTFAGCRKVNDESSMLSNINSDSAVNYTDVEIVDNNSETQSTEDATNVSDDSSVTNNSSATESTVSVEEPNTNTNPDGVVIYGSGTKEDPYIDTPNADSHSIKTLTVPAGSSVYYSIYRVGGRILTINDANAYVVCDGTKHIAQNGVLSFKVVNALASDAVLFEIGNTSSSTKSFTIAFADVQGSMANPTVLNNFGKEISISLEEGNDIGHFYKYVATQAGTLKFYLLSDVEQSIILATNNRNSAQRSTESSEEGEVKTDSTGTYIELEVEKDDEIIITVGAKPNKRGKYPAVDIKWLIKY